jgi:hypothetical protein
MTVAGRAQGNGQCERANGVILDLLRTTILDSKDKSDWEQLLPYCQIQYNRTESTATGFSPYHLDLGYEPTFPDEIPRDIIKVDACLEDPTTMASRMQEMMNEAIARMSAASEKLRRLSELQANAKSVHSPGDYVWLGVEKGKLAKLNQRQYGPFRVLSSTDETVTLVMPGSYKGHPVFNYRRVLTFKPSPNSPRPYYPMPHRSSTVQAILSHREARVTRSNVSSFQYETKWYNSDAITWEPRKAFIKNNVVQPVLVDYEARLREEMLYRGSSQEERDIQDRRKALHRYVIEYAEAAEMSEDENSSVSSEEEEVAEQEGENSSDDDTESLGFILISHDPSLPLQST